MWSVARVTRHAALLAWVAAGLALAGSVAAFVLLSQAGQGADVEWKQLLLPVVWAAPGALIAAGRPRNPVGWLMLGVALLFVGAGLSQAWVAHALAVADPSGVAWALWFTDRASAFLVVFGLLMLLLLPDGRLPSRRWRTPVVLLMAVQAVALTTFALVRGPAVGPDTSFPAAVRSVANPVGLVPGEVGDLLLGADVFLLQLPLLLVPLAFAAKLRHSAGDERARVAGVLLAATAFVLVVVLGHAVWPAASDVLDVAASLLLAVVLTASVLRHRLREIDYAVHHAFVFAVLTLLIASVYVAVTSLASRFGDRLPPFGAGVVAAMTALALLPLRSRLQALAGRMLYGDRGDPYAALSRLAETTHDAPTLESVLGSLAASVRSSLRAVWVSVEAGGQQVSLGNRRRQEAGWTVPLVSGDVEIGTVRVMAGSARRFTTDDRRLLADLGRHGGMAVHAVMLAEAVRASRQHLVEAREEERRRIGRDLHDELGPTIAGLAMQLGALGTLVDTDPAAATERLSRLADAAQQALDQVRRVARELRPPALEQVGVLESLRQLAGSLGLTLVVDGALPARPPAAVEVAAYRIAGEALTNIARHADVSTVDLRVAVTDGSLVLSVRDDGAGFGGDHVPGLGLGLAGMRERAEELGGSLSIASVRGSGTTVTVSLPWAQQREVVSS